MIIKILYQIFHGSSFVLSLYLGGCGRKIAVYFKSRIHCETPSKTKCIYWLTSKPLLHFVLRNEIIDCKILDFFVLIICKCFCLLKLKFLTSELSDLFYISSIIVFHGNSFPLFEIYVSVYYVQLESDIFVALLKTRAARAVLAWSP